MDIDSQPLADRTEVDQLLHQLRSTLARLKAEIELMIADDRRVDHEMIESTTQAIDLLGAIEDRVRGERSSAVIVIDDDRRLAEAVSRQLTRVGFRAIAMAGLDDLPANIPAGTGILVDLGLLRLAGRDQSARIKSLAPIVMTGSTDPMAKVEARLYGAAACLTKPVDVEELARILRFPSGGQRSSADIKPG